MKTQNIFKISSLTLLFTSQVSCSIRLLETITGNRQINLTDSSSNLFKVTIFPLDTFTFSLESGFKGKAMRIEATGIRQQVKKIVDSSEVFVEKESRLEYDSNKNVLKVESSNTRIVEKKRVSWLLGLAVIVIISLVVWFWWKRR